MHCFLLQLSQKLKKIFDFILLYFKEAIEELLAFQIMPGTIDLIPIQDKSCLLGLGKEITLEAIGKEFK